MVSRSTCVRSCGLSMATPIRWVSSTTRTTFGILSSVARYFRARGELCQVEEEGSDCGDLCQCSTSSRRSMTICSSSTRTSQAATGLAALRMWSAAGRQCRTGSRLPCTPAWAGRKADRISRVGPEAAQRAAVILTHWFGLNSLTGWVPSSPLRSPSPGC